MHPEGTLFILILALTAQDVSRAGRIIGGREARAHSRPYMVLVEMQKPTDTTYCGGILLREDFVMTAAHCIASSYTAKMGLHNFRNQLQVQNITVEKEFTNEDYNAKTFGNDIKLLKLSSKAKLTSEVSTIAVAGPEDAEPQGCSVAGWGCTSNANGSHMSPVLKEVEVTLTQCNQKDQDDFFCSEGYQGVGHGDSGGPLVCGNEKVYGVVSSKYGDSLHLFARVQKHKKWIDSIMNSY